MAMKIAILEDNIDRQEVMRAYLTDRFYMYDICIFDDASEMITFLHEHLTDTLVISLDHDLELKPGLRIVATDVFDDPNLPGEMRTTYTMSKVSVGTELNIVQENIPAAIPPEACYLGWQESLELLAKLVEPEIPNP